MSFHTKSIERILSPVAQQVLKLILLFEDAGSGTEIPDLEFRVNVVKLAVDNLIKVGHQTIEASDDQLLQRDMPPSLKRVEDASFYLQDAVVLLQNDPSSSEARKKLIEGSRGILQGTSSVLLTFDLSEVRKIIRHCRRVLCVLATAEDVSTLTDLADFVKRLTPCMADMIKEVDNRQDELTIQSHSALLLRGIEQVKRLTPILISSLKLHVNTHLNHLPGAAESQANRDFLLSEMSSEIHEIIRGLQLTETDSSELFDDDLAAMHMNKAAFDSRLQFVSDWISDSNCSTTMTAGEKILNQALISARNLANLNPTSSSSKAIIKLCDELNEYAQSLIRLRRSGHGNGSEAEHIVNTLSTKLNQLSRLCKGLSLRDGSAAASGGDQHQHLCNPLFRLARTLEGKLVQAQRWLADPRGPLRHVGLEACRSLAQGAKSIMMSVFDDDALTNSTMNGNSKEEDRETSDACLEACEHVERVSGRLFAMSSQPITEENEIGQQDLAVATSRSLAYIWQTLEKLLTRQIAEVYTDLVGPLRQLVESASPSSGNLPDQNNYNVKTKEFLAQCNQLVSTGELAAATKLSDVWRSDALRCLTSQLNELGSQVVLAGRAVVLSADPNLQLQPGGASLKQATSDHFLLMRQHWTDTAERMRTLVDEAVDANAFIAAQETGMLRDSAKTESSIVEVSTTGVVEATTRIARRANRVLQLITREADNSEDPLYVDRMNDAVKALRSTITPMVNDAKGLVTNIEDPRMHEQWRLSNRNLLTAVNSVKQAVSPFNNPITYYHEHCHPMSSSMHKNGIASANKSSINNSCNNTHINNNNNNNSISSSKSSQSSAKEIMSSIPLREMQEMSITDVSHMPYSFLGNNNINNDYTYRTSHCYHKPVYEIKLSNPFHHSSSLSPPPSSPSFSVPQQSQDYYLDQQQYQQSNPHHQTTYSVDHYTNNVCNNHNSFHSPPTYHQHQHCRPHSHSQQYSHNQIPNLNTYLTRNNDYLRADEEQQQKQPGTISPNDAVGSVAGTVLVRPSSPDTEADDEFNFPPPEENQPIMAAAHALHHETRLWSSRDNELIAATKRMAALMAQLSQIVRGEYGTKKDLINVSMAIAEASLDVNQCAKVLAKECTDRRIRSVSFMNFIVFLPLPVDQLSTSYLTCFY
ncbi:Vinculin [Schistosoma japonicum]|uniref:Vinculin n=1 Tax=Schistosoma japonicum TaxID=6182 RepID=A0A4Z2D923_SCHJA|nr:Vinculin [Schistosoma japonicum]